MDIDTNSDAYKAGERFGNSFMDAIRKMQQTRIHLVLHAESPPASGVYTPSGPVVDSTITPVESGVLALPDAKCSKTGENTQ